MIESRYKFYNYFIPVAFRFDPVLYTQAVIWITVVAFNTAFALFALLYIEFIMQGTADDMNLAIGRSLVLFNLATYLLARLFYYWLHRLRLAGHIVTFGLFSSTLCGILLTGGYGGSPLPVFLIIPCLFAFVMMGLGPGICWSVLAMGLMVVMWILEQLQWLHPIQVIDDVFILEQVAKAVPLAILAMVAGGMIIYEVITVQFCNSLQQEKNKYQWDATHDSLTGLPNRTEFDQRLAAGMRDVEINHQSLTLVYIDLDGFKPVNDTLGHQVGDEVLKIVSRRLQGIFRGSDTVARVGGDEFAIILQEKKHDNDMLGAVLTKVLRVISEMMVINGKPMSVGCSIGVAYYTGDGSNVSELCRRADTALYKAKEKKNTWAVYGDALMGEKRIMDGFATAIF